jgi:hypothetical protein
MYQKKTVRVPTVVGVLSFEKHRYTLCCRNIEKQPSSFRSSFVAGSKVFKIQIVITNTFSRNEYL